MRIVQTLFLIFLCVIFASCNGVNGGYSSGESGGKTIELVGGYVAKSYYDKTKQSITTKIDYDATINGTPVFEFVYKNSSDRKYLFLTNFDITKPEDFNPNLRVWHIYLHPAVASKNKIITYLAKDEDEPSKYENNLKILKIEVIDNKYFDPDNGKPLHLKLTVEKYGEIIIKGVKR